MEGTWRKSGLGILAPTVPQPWQICPWASATAEGYNGNGLQLAFAEKTEAE